jgi:hypothetical protein
MGWGGLWAEASLQFRRLASCLLGGLLALLVGAVGLCWVGPCLFLSRAHSLSS